MESGVRGQFLVHPKSVRKPTHCLPTAKLIVAGGSVHLPAWWGSGLLFPDPLPKTFSAPHGVWAAAWPVEKGHRLHGILSGSRQPEDTKGSPIGQHLSALLASKPEERVQAWSRGLVDTHFAEQATGFDGVFIAGHQPELLLLGTVVH